MSTPTPTPTVIINRKTGKAFYFKSMTAAANKLKVFPADIRNAMIGRNGTTHVHNHVVIEAPLI
jgi:hypothetical protein